jgi:hypothetical protein
MYLVKEINGIAHDRSLKKLAQSYGLAVNTVSWEDTGRTKGSCLGSNISDMTLRVGDFNMPVFRRPNFADVTADRNIEDFRVVVGNESGNSLMQIPLKKYLENLCLYTDNPNIKPMLLERDSKILVSSQACLLPLHDGEVDFCVQLYNYQSHYSSDPAVLTIISTAQGTTSQVAFGQTKLYMNHNGNAHELKAKRLSDDRLERGVKLSGPMTSDEKNKNAVFIYQIPLKQHSPRDDSFFCMADLTEDYDSGADDCVSMEMTSRGRGAGMARGLEKAILSKGKCVGTFYGTGRLTLERNEELPIRCTVQYYNVTDTPIITMSQMNELFDNINSVYSTASVVGSLVLSNSTRITEPTITKMPVPKIKDIYSITDSSVLSDLTKVTKLSILKKKLARFFWF